MTSPPLSYQPSYEYNYIWSGYVGAVIGCAPIIPLLAAISTTAIYSTGMVPTVFLARHPVLAGALVALAAWLVLSLLYNAFGFASARGANNRVYGELRERLQQMTTQLARAAVVEPAPAQGNVPEGGFPVRLGQKEAETHRDYVAAELSSAARGLRWVLATGYINLWRQVHRAEEALIDVMPTTSVLQGALYDELRLKDSTIAKRNELLDELRVAVLALNPTARTLLTSSPQQVSDTTRHLTEAEARAVLRHVRMVINEARDSSRGGLVRVRNYLNATILLTGLCMYALLAFVISQPVAPRPSIIVSATELYFIGAIVGLFTQLAAEAWADISVEDYSLFLARLINMSMFSGLAAVLGVALTALLVPPIIGTPISSKGPLLVDAYDLGRHPYGLIIAAAFGLTPNLFLRRWSHGAAR